ncbi:MAG TPA: deoxyhypusine synthase [Deltaproteobacteria bacterium]|nr:deoxyhypusine synthase [Deltaproteobacteria bacterium]HCP46506.1 deoxyhypusine synthase [Deltaproteobacteria bacterium]
MKRNEQLGTGHSEGLEPLEPLDVVAAESMDDLLSRMAKTAFGGRCLGEAADVLHAMVMDPDCWVVGTFSGAMTVAKQGLLLVEMLDRGMLDAVVSTGALMAHGLVEGAGMQHFKRPQGVDDAKLFAQGYDRVYDTLELEANLNDVERLLQGVLEDCDPEEVLCSRTLLARMGQRLEALEVGPSILGAAVRNEVPVYVPAFTDSELALDVAFYNEGQLRAGRNSLRFDPFLDLEHFRAQAAARRTLGIFTIGGGVPRNWAQQVACYEDLRRQRYPDLSDQESIRYRYGVRICPEPVHWGGLSGCTYSEGISWGKFVPPSEGGLFAEVPADATIAWPILLRAVIERVEKA